MKVTTTHGLVERSELTTKDDVTEDENNRITATEWYRGEEMVRRDVWVVALRGLEMAAEATRAGGV